MNKHLLKFMLNLEELIEDSKSIYIIGHKDPDFDAIGASVGVSELCKALKKESKIIVNEDKFVLQPAVKLLQDSNKKCKFINNYDYISDLEKALTREEKLIYKKLDYSEKQIFLKDVKKDKSLLIVVDTNNHELLSIKDYLNNFDNIVVIDHHTDREDQYLQGLQFIDSNYSSASEIVGTILHQYKTKYSKETALSLASGIILDTDTFKRNTTDNTYDTYKVFKQNGVTDEEIRRIFRKDFEADKLVKNLVFNNGNAKEFTNLLKNHNVSIVLNRHQPETIYKSEMISMAADERQEYDDVDASIVMGYISCDGQTPVKISIRTNGYVDGGQLMKNYCENEPNKSGGGSILSAAATIKGVDLLEEEKCLLDYLDKVVTEKFKVKKKVK